MAIRKRDDTWLEHVFKIDSGSDITFMNKQECYNLGYTLSDCETRYYTDTNNGTYRVYVRPFTVKIGGGSGDYEIKKVPIGFSSKRVPMNLLGREKIFDSLNICFDCESKQTVIFTPNEN
jgi:hypothetical protein